MKKKDIDLLVDLPGLVTIFGEALYEDFGSIIRELIQNAHDAIIEHCSNYNDGEEKLREHKIYIKFKKNERLLLVADNGKGMSADEIAESLNNFARSKKKEIEERLQDNINSNSARKLLHIVGEYGVGFLSAMAVSEDLSVWSKTIEGEVTCWSYSTGQSNASSFSVSQNEFNDFTKSHFLGELASGTVVICNLKDKIFEDYYLNEDAIQKSVSQFSGLLPIYVEFNGELISCKYTAWDNPALATPDDWKDVISGMHGQSPLLIIPIYSPPNELDLQGVLWIPERTSYFSRPNLDVYVKRMFVLKDAKIIIPEWARFISGIVNSNKIKRIVSGNTIKNDILARKTRSLIKDRIIEEFKKLRRRNEFEYMQIIGPHDDAIKGSASDDIEFRECVWDKLRFPAKDRKLTIPEYIKKVKTRTQNEEIFYCDELRQIHSSDLVSEATGIPILNVTQTRDDRLLREIASEKNYSLLSFRHLADKHFTAPKNNDIYSSLIDACAAWNIDAEIREYSPSYLPAVIIEDKTFQDRRDQLLRGLKEHGEEFFAKSLEKLFKKQHSANAGVSFYLNSSNTLINQLSNAEYEDQMKIALALYNISFMAAVPDLRDNEKKTVYESISNALSGAINQKNIFIRQYDEKEVKDCRDKNKPITLFMITPFSDEYKVIEEVIRSVFEAPPYFFKVLLARDYTYNSGVLSNIKSHINASDAFVAEISDLNPNVMLELGAVLFSDENKPIFSLRRLNSDKSVPADIKSQIYIEYSSLGSNSINIKNEIKQSLERDGRTAHEGIANLLSINAPKALTKTLIQMLGFKLRVGECNSLLGYCQTVDQFLSSSSGDIALKTGIKDYAIEALQKELKEFL